jgi:hypothetical protein
MQLKSTEGKWSNSTTQAMTILRKYWPERLAESCRGMRQRIDQMGVVFDIYED